MAYTMTRTAEHLAIAERQFCRSNMVKFTRIDSCMGIIARKGHFITGAHLVLNYGEPGIAISNADVPVIVSVFHQEPYDEIWFVGELAGWNQIMQAFEGAKANWFPNEDAEFSYKPVRGIIGARISSAGAMVLHHRP
jgi:hypothetical protein